MHTTLDNPTLTETAEQDAGAIARTGSASPSESFTPPVIVCREPAAQKSLKPQRSIEVGPYITPAIAAFLTMTALGAVIVGAAGWADVSPFPIIAAALFVFFAGLFARIQFGGGKWLPLVGVVLLPVLAIFATAAPHLDDGVGDRSYHPTSFEDVEASYEFGIGNLEVDLRDIDFPPGEHVINIQHGIGAARVQLPADVSYSVSGEVGVGKLDLLGQADDGFNTTLDAESGPGSDTTIVLDFDTSIGYGSVEND